MLGDFFGAFGGQEMSGNDGPAAKTVAELLDAAPGNVSILVNGVKRADIQTVVADPNLEVTIFAPTNIAFEAALLKLKISPAQLYADKVALTNILSYHVVNRVIQAKDFKDDTTVDTVNQKQLKVRKSDVLGVSIEGATETARILTEEIWAGKTVIYVVDTVLIPPQPPSY
jgi:uncharacterized surface protein with fasciclin (FAS1) repeats